MFAFQFCPKLQDKHCKNTVTVTMTMIMTGKIRYIHAPSFKERACTLFFLSQSQSQSQCFCNVYPVALDRTRRQTLLICIMTMTMTMTKNKIQNQSLNVSLPKIFKNRVEKIQAAAYNGPRTVVIVHISNVCLLVLSKATG